MKKLRMDPEALDVQSFAVAPAEPVFGGTVQGADAFATPGCSQFVTCLSCADFCPPPAWLPAAGADR